MADDPKKQPDHSDEDVKEAADESFPASDPPAYSGGTATPREDGRDPGHLDHDEDGDDDS